MEFYFGVLVGAVLVLIPVVVHGVEKNRYIAKLERDFKRYLDHERGELSKTEELLAILQEAVENYAPGKARYDLLRRCEILSKATAASLNSTLS